MGLYIILVQRVKITFILGEGVIDREKSRCAIQDRGSPLSCKYLDPSAMSTDEVGSPVKLSAGSFATVYVISGGLIAFKEVSHIDNTEKLRQECHTLDNIYSFSATPAPSLSSLAPCRTSIHTGRIFLPPPIGFVPPAHSSPLA